MGLFDRLRQRLSRANTSDPEATRVTGRPVASAAGTSQTDPAPSLNDVNPRFAVVDVETTGLSATTHRILEIAVVTTDPHGQVLDTWTTRLNPQGPVGATHIHGISDHDVAHAPLFADVIDELNARLRGAAIAGHNAKFDLAFLRAEYARAGWRMPFVPALCTLEASTHYVPGLPRRRLIDVCAAVGVPPHQAHSALHDATATAALLASFLHPGRPPRQVDINLPLQGHAIVWPVNSEGAPVRIATGGATSGHRLSDRARRNMATSTTAPATKPLAKLIGRFSLLDAHDEGAPEGSVAYLEKLAEVLQDGVLDPAEAAALTDVADTYDLTLGHIDAAHLAFVRALAREAMADGKLTRAERTELTGIASALGVPTTAISAVLADATSHHHAQRAVGLAPLPADWSHGEPLRVGDRVVFTGCDPDVRERLERQSEASGVRVMNGVARTTAMLITDGLSAGTKTRKATELGTRTVEPDTFRYLLQHLQPATAREAQSANAHKPNRTDDPSPPTTPEPARTQPTDSPPAPTPAELRAWGRTNGWVLGQRGRLPKELSDAYEAAHHS